MFMGFLIVLQWEKWSCSWVCSLFANRVQQFRLCVLLEDPLKFQSQLPLTQNLNCTDHACMLTAMETLMRLIRKI